MTKPTVMGDLIDWGQQNFPVTGQVVNTLAFVSHIWFLLHLLLLHLLFKKKTTQKTKKQNQSFKSVNHS